MSCASNVSSGKDKTWSNSLTARHQRRLQKATCLERVSDEEGFEVDWGEEREVAEEELLVAADVGTVGKAV